MRLDPGRAALLVVDVQEKLMPAIHGREPIVRNAALLLRLARTLGLPIVATTQYAKGLGGLVAELGREGEIAPIDKTSFGCFGAPAFCERLSELRNVTQLLVAGVETHICVTQTVLGAIERGLAVHVVSDAVGSRAPANHAVGLTRMERAGAVVSSTEMAVYELLGRSDTTAFKTMLPLLKG